ncbi:MAG: GGDEF domain-containing protein [Campylobacterota bacterium]|nr:GGDEF domain-containing protein [Campylobacterota bacterium]
MKANEEILQVISNETKESVINLSVVTPTIYTTQFYKYAHEHDTEIEDEPTITDNLLRDKILHFTDMQEKTSSSVIQLSENTSKAISAIEKEDSQLLEKVLQETKILRDEIDRLRESVHKDELTHLYNRRWLNDTFISGETQCFNKNGLLAIIDLNYFKSINDNYGHIVGDKVLMFIAKNLQRITKDVVRYGGDEFIVLFDESQNIEEAIQKLNTIRKDILHKKLKIKEASFKVSFSFGLVHFKSGDLLTDSLEIADKNMYADKLRIKKIIASLS